MADDMGNLSEEFESLFEGEDFSETLTRARFEKLNTDLFRETLKPVPEFLEDDDLTKMILMRSFLLEVQSEFQRFSPIFGGFPKGKDQERKGEMGDNMR